jgi:crotonobetaine/carnitine-CoA ligase
MDVESNKTAAGLQAVGLEKDDKVGIMMSNRPEYIFLWFGLCKLGAVEVPINVSHRGDLLGYMLRKADCRMLVVEYQYLDRIVPILRQLPKMRTLIVLDVPEEGLDELKVAVHEYSELVDNDGKYVQVEVDASDPFAIMFTSGTTGPSKGSLLPHGYAIHMGDIISRATCYTEEDCLYNVLPLYHGNAQLLSTFPAMMSGARVVLRERFSASRFWDDVKKYGCTEFNYIGAILPILFKAEPKPDDADNPLRIMLGGGAPMDLFKTIEKRFGVKLIEGYGMSEIGLPLMNTVTEREPSTCGKLHPDYEVSLVNDSGLPVGPETPGELLVRPKYPNCMLLEYYNMPQKTVEAWRNCWFHTGDYLYYDQDGYFHFVDRKKDALRRRGENISSYEVEKAINSHDAVLECAAIGVKSEMGEDEVMVCIRLKPDHTLTPIELMKHCESKMAYFMIPRYVRFMEQLPKTPTQRTEKYRLREEGVTPDTWDRESEGYILKR